MSYLNNLRLIFSGDFQADTSTINNDVRHFDNSTFEDRFQEYQDDPVMNGWFNPMGSGAFRLLNCKVSAVRWSDGTDVFDANTDPVVGLRITGSDNRVGAKLVDLDPQWQMSSQIWGLQVRLSDDEPVPLFTGNFKPAPFRDILFGRLGLGTGDESASAIFQSILSDVKWRQDFGSRFLSELKDVSSKGELSIRITTFGISSDHTSDRFTIGTVIGAIGPRFQNEPESFVAGRRMVPINGTRTVDDINFFDCEVDANSGFIHADFGNALPLTDAAGFVTDIGEICLGILRNESTPEGERIISGRSFFQLGPAIPYRSQNWLQTTAGIFSAEIPDLVRDDIASKPLAVVRMLDRTKGVVLIRETTSGLFVRADDFVKRVEPGEGADIVLYARKYGAPLADARIHITQMGPIPNIGGGSASELRPPKAEVPVINSPAEAIVDYSKKLKTGNDGKAVVHIKTKPPGNPRKYIDGQIYTFTYSLEHQPSTEQQQIDWIVLLLFDDFDVPDQPTWIGHIEPILKQYSNLYPVMSKRFFDIGDYRAVAAHRQLLELAFSLDPADPNFMPVTRDLSLAKRTMILTWLREKTSDDKYLLRYGSQLVPPASHETRSGDVGRPVHVEKHGGKARFHGALLDAKQASRGNDNDD